MCKFPKYNICGFNKLNRRVHKYYENDAYINKYIICIYIYLAIFFSGTLSTIALAETIVERISYELALDPLEARLANLDYANYKDLKEMSSMLVETAEYYYRKQYIASFNFQNRWKKRGLRFSFLRWRNTLSSYLDANLSVYHEDGTVSLTHSAIEMGQGIDTKAAQLCAYLLKIPVEKVQIKTNDTTISPNAFSTVGSVTSQYILVNVRQCCEELLKRLEPVRQQMNDPTWAELIKKAFEASVDLQTHGFVGDGYTNDYDVYGVTLAEVEIDVLTGEHEVLRVDLLQDVGQSVNPAIDVGQVSYIQFCSVIYEIIIFTDAFITGHIHDLCPVIKENDKHFPANSGNIIMYDFYIMYILHLLYKFYSTGGRRLHDGAWPLDFRASNIRSAYWRTTYRPDLELPRAVG